MTKRILAILALSAISAQADEIVSISETFSETITSGIDAAGLFGASGADLTGDTITLNINWDVDPNPAGPPYASSTLLEYVGADQWSTGWFGALQETVTLNSKTFLDDGSANSDSTISGADSTGTPAGLTLDDDVIGGEPGYPNSNEIRTNLSLAAATGNIVSQAGADALFTAVTGGTVDIYACEGEPGSCAFSDPNLSTAVDILTFASPTPEPGTWLAMALGLCGIGIVRR